MTKRFLEHRFVQGTIIGLIIINAIILGLETSPTIMAQWGWLLGPVDRAILAIFVLELVGRIFIYRRQFFADPWSLFDLLVVTISIAPSSENFAVLRVLRVLRVFRLLSAAPALRRVVEGLFRAVPGIASVAGILIMVFYVFGVIGTQLYSASFPEWFGTLGRTLFTLFQIMTLESWSMGIVRPILEVYPFAWVYFVLYIMITTFTTLNLVIAIVVNAMEDPLQEEKHDEQNAVLITRLDQINARLERLENKASTRQNGQDI